MGAFPIIFLCINISLVSTYNNIIIIIQYNDKIILILLLYNSRPVRQVTPPHLVKCACAKQPVAHTHTHTHTHTHSTQAHTQAQTHTANTHTRTQTLQDNGKIEITSQLSAHSPRKEVISIDYTFLENLTYFQILHTFLSIPQCLAILIYPPPTFRLFQPPAVDKLSQVRHFVYRL